MRLAYPLHLDARGRTATADLDTYVRGLIEQVLFTAQGERVNRPTFGSSIMQLVFAPNSSQLASAVEMLVQGALQQWLSDLVQLEQVTTERTDSTIAITVQYRVRLDGTRRTERFEREV